MVEYGPNANLEGGVPFGGIGTGKVEIDNEGKMSNLTILTTGEARLRRCAPFTCLWFRMTERHSSLKNSFQ